MYSVDLGNGNGISVFTHMVTVCGDFFFISYFASCAYHIEGGKIKGNIYRLRIGIHYTFSNVYVFCLSLRSNG